MSYHLIIIHHPDYRAPSQGMFSSDMVEARERRRKFVIDETEEGCTREEFETWVTGFFNHIIEVEVKVPKWLEELVTVYIQGKKVEKEVSEGWPGEIVLHWVYFLQ